MRLISCVLCAVLMAVTVLCLFGCTPSQQPAYMTPYGDGVDPDTVTTVPFQSRTYTTAALTTTHSSETQTTVLTTTTELMIPEGYILCPQCHGVRVVCAECQGTNKMKAEIYYPEAGVYARKYVDCTFCSAEDPGYMLCEVCLNKLIVEE